MAETIVVIPVQPAPVVTVAPVQSPIVEITLEPAPIVEAPQLGPPGPPGPPGPLAEMVTGQIPAGAIDGINHVYTCLSAYVPHSLAVFLNGLRQRRGDDYNETGAMSFQLLNAPLPGDSLSVDYIVNG